LPVLSMPPYLSSSSFFTSRFIWFCGRLISKSWRG
jgi:hypothetical protein